MFDYKYALRAALWAVCLSLAMARVPQSFAAEGPADWSKAHVDELVSLYIELHQAPELSKYEEATGRRIGEELKKLGIETTTGVGGTGVVGLLKNGPGQIVMLRTDLDALPVTEQTGLPYASKVVVHDEQRNEVGVMHACGHDIHMTNLIGVARYLASHRDQWSGTVMFVGQPAEERGAGARAMLEDGLFTRFPKPDLALALHVDSSMPTGKVGFRAGPNMANVDSVDITLKGRGGHGAYPHMTVDPVAMAAYLIVDLQSIVAREVGPTDPAVITVGSIHGGAKHNVIGDICHLQLTVRSYTDEVRKHLLAAIRRKSLAVAQSYRAPEPVITLSEGTPALSNDAALVERVVPTFRRVLGEENVVPAEPTMGGEDFSEYGRAGVPIFMYRLGSVEQPRLDRFQQLGVDPPTLHSPLYYPEPRETLTVGVTTMASAVLDLLPKAN
jgi:hippurate hydrolase